MTILAATLAGGDNNQDRYVIGDNFAAVLDGATSFAGDRSHDPGWYAEQLGHALTETVPRHKSLSDAVVAAIRSVRKAHRLKRATTPTSTIALARWDGGVVETYVLGDSSAIVLHSVDSPDLVVTDDLIDTVATAERATYRARLASGAGYDDEEVRAALLALQAEQARKRNRRGGFWIAGAEPRAGRYGHGSVTMQNDVTAVLLATDGVALDRHPTATTWRDLYDEAQRDGAAAVLQCIHDAEDTDPDGRRWPRAKPHDDKSLVAIPFGTPGSPSNGRFKEYRGIIWIGDQPGLRVSVLARSALEARAQVVARYGEGHVITLANDADANRPR